MVNTINWYVNKKSSKLFIRYRINGKRRDETIVNLDYYSEPKTVNEIKTNNKSKKLAQRLVDSKRVELFKSDNGLDYFENQQNSFLDYYNKIAHEKGVKNKNTLGGYMTTISRFKSFLDKRGQADVSIKQVDFGFCGEYRAFLEGCTDIANTSKQKYFKTFKYICAQLHNQGLHQKYVCQNIKGITGKYQRHDYLTTEEFQAMYDTPTLFMDKTQTRRFFIFSCLTGLPHRECMKLKWSDFYKETDKNGDVFHYYNWIRSKTQKPYKNPLSQDAVEYMSILFNTKSCDTFVFPNLKYSAHENNKLQTWANMADVKKKISPHCARATFANVFVRTEGCSIMDLKELMGHSDVKTTLMYIGTSLQEKTEAIRKMPRLLNPKNDIF